MTTLAAKAGQAPQERTSCLEQEQLAPIIGTIAAALDRTLPVPLGVQLRGLIEYGIACGELAPGTQLPSVREFAEAGGIAPMTVSGVYKDLRMAGLIVTRPGAGTFVAQPARDAAHTIDAMQRIEERMDALLAEAELAGVGAEDLAALLNARIARVRARKLRPVRITMVGVFKEATKAYATDIARQLRSHDVIDAVTIDQLRESAKGDGGTDLYVTLANRRQEVEGLVEPGSPVISISFIPSEKTRTLLAAIDPVARIGIVSVFPEFLALMKPGVLRFTPHVQSVEVALAEDPDLEAFLSRTDVVVYATGVESVLGRLPSHARAIEYRHVPDPHAVQRDLLPIIERLRAGLPLKETSV
jgi:DNA-binding transcriptional regulator YhcF (GntR family)